MATVIELHGDAAADAQTLVAMMAERGIDLDVVNHADSNRDVTEVAISLGVAFVSQVSAGLLIELVKDWVRVRGHRAEDAVVSDPAEPSQ